jgi:hypothetical protein
VLNADELPGRNDGAATPAAIAAGNALWWLRGLGISAQAASAGTVMASAASSKVITPSVAPRTRPWSSTP